MYKRGICWIRRDLRLHDHRALCEATRQCEEVVVAFVFDTEILSKLKSKCDRRVDFIFQTLVQLDRDLEAKGSRLVWLHGQARKEIVKLAKLTGADAVFTNEDYEPLAKNRDTAVGKELKKAGIAFQTFKDHVIFSGGEVLKDDGSPYRVFTPYKNSWLKRLSESEVQEARPDLKRLARAQGINGHESFALKKLGFESSSLKVSSARMRLKNFSKHFSDYASERDFPAVEGTSHLSVHLRFGTISIRECVRACLENQRASSTWLSELIWREFFQMILDRFPFVKNESFNPKYRDLKWPGKPEHFEKWCEGKTGYGIVDAGMRQLNETGWMHNRLRMISASFLVKDLLIDWRWGEKYFAEKLLDFDLAANNGGWQWCASTGCDAQPYFRIFNPVSQSKKLDPEGLFIKKFVPELGRLDARSIHEPVNPIVAHELQRAKALKLYKRQ